MMDRVGNPAQAEQLIRAVEAALSPTTDPQIRAQSYTYCEQFKEEANPLACTAVGFQLISCYPSARHFGLQLVEHCIKFRWFELEPQDKMAIKESVWSLMSPDKTQLSSLEASHIKDGIARLVVEMAKQEWPQQWPTLLQELSELTVKEENYFQAELVLLILLRLTEDVVVFQSVPDPSRRRDLHGALTSGMGDIFQLLSNLLNREVVAYQNQLQTNSTDELTIRLHCRLARSVLAVFQVLVDWVSIQHVMANEGQLLVQLCLLLSDRNLRLPAAECLLQAAGRKGAAKERKPLLVLFDAAAIGAILEAAQQGAAEDDYAFFKKLAELLVAIGGQLCNLYGKESDVTLPSTLGLYCRALLALSGHPSTVVNHTCAGLWLLLFRHEQLRIEADLLAVVQPFLEQTTAKIVKPAQPGPYDRLDFDSAEEFFSVYIKFRADLLDSVRQVALNCPLVAFELAQRWLDAQLSSSAVADVSQWEALAMFADAVCSRAGPTVIEQHPAVGIQLLERCLSWSSWSSVEPTVLSEALSCLSALFVFVQLDPGRLLRPVLDRILQTLMLAREELNGNGKISLSSSDDKGRAIREVRRHACSLMVKISSQSPSVLIRELEFLRAGIDRLDAEGRLGKMELCTLKEALLIISNQLGSAHLQSELIGQLMRPALEKWTGAALQPALCGTAQDFMQFVGLLDANPSEVSEEGYGQNRAELSASVSLFLAVVRRCKMTDPGRSSVHPAAPHVAPLLVNLFRLARILHELYEPEARAKLAPAYAKVHDLLESEIGGVLAMGGLSHLHHPSARKDESSKGEGRVERVQQFLLQLHSNVLTVLGFLGETLGREFYGQAGLATAVAGTVCYGTEYVPDYRLRSILRSFCRPFISSCPPDLREQVLAPFLSYLLPSMLQRLSARWQATTETQTAKAYDESDIQEVVRDVMIRLLTRDYLDVVRCILLTGSSSSSAGQTQLEDDEMVDANSTTTAAQAACQVALIGDLGMGVLSNRALSRYLLECLLSALWWPDTGNSTKSCGLLHAIVKYWTSLPPGSPGFPDNEMATLCLTHLLNGLRVLGQHEGNLNALLTLGAQLYDALIPAYPDALAGVLVTYAGTKPEDITSYREKCAFALNASGGNKQNQKMEKAKREMFRKMTSQIVGQHLADLFRKPVVLAPLPKLVPRTKKPTNDDVLDQADLANLFVQD